MKSNDKGAICKFRPLRKPLLLLTTHEASMASGQPAPAAPPAAADERGIHIRRWLLCCSGRHLFALPLDHVIETMRALPIEAVTRAPAYVCGLSIIRGAPTIVIDSARLLGEETGPHDRFVTLSTGARTVAIATASVLGVVEDAHELSELPPLLQDAADTITSIGARDAELLLCLQASRLVPDEVLDRLDLEGVPA